MRYLHTMVRVSDLDSSLSFYRDIMGLIEVNRIENKENRFTLVFLAAPSDVEHANQYKTPLLELTYNWDNEEYKEGRNFGHIAFEVDNIYEYCDKLDNAGVTINRPPRDGYMAFIRSPDNISIEILQKGSALAPNDKWTNKLNIGHW